MNPRPSRRTISLRAAGVSALLTVVGATAFAVPTIATASAVSVNTSPDSVQTFTPGQNNPSGWPDCTDGTKMSYDGQNKTTYTLSSPATLLVIKAATWNFIWNDPTAGVYDSPVAPDGKVHAISHVIVCGVVTTTHTETATASESMSESASATGSDSTTASGSATGSQSTTASGSATGSQSTTASGSATGSQSTTASGSATGRESASSSDTATASAFESDTVIQIATETAAETATRSTSGAAATGPSASSSSIASLAHTGGDPVRLGGIALALLGLGIGFWAVGSRRGTAPRHL